MAHFRSGIGRWSQLAMSSHWSAGSISGVLPLVRACDRATISLRLRISVMLPPRPEGVVPIVDVIRRETQHHMPLAVFVGDALDCGAAWFVVVAEDVQLAHVIGDMDPMHAAGAE